MFPRTKFGRFIDDNRAYRITTPYPPRVMTNVLHSREGYLGEFTHWGTGSASVKFFSGETNNIVVGDNKTLYCRDEGTSDVWCPGVYPMMSEVEKFACEHHDTFTQITSLRRGVEVVWRIFIPLHGYREIWTVTVKNRTKRTRRISLVPAAKLDLTGFKTIRFFGGQGHYSICEWREDVGGLYFKAGNPQAGYARYNAFLATAPVAKSYCGDMLHFLGAPLAMHHPHLLLGGADLGNKVGFSSDPFVAVRCELRVASGRSARADIVFGVVESPEEAAGLVREISAPERVETLFEETRHATRERRDRLVINTPDPKIDAFVNLWLKKGLEYCLRRKDATRDNLQFADGLTMSNPEVVRNEILRVMRWQFADGRTLRSWVPLDTTDYGDGPFWPVLTVCGYLKFTDDLALLETQVPYFDQGIGTVREHLERAIRSLDTRRGPRGLPLLRFAEWNDAFHLSDPQAESVFCAMGFGFALKEMAALMRHIGEAAEAEKYQRMHAELKRLVNEVAWDEEGGYYVTAFAFGEVFGGTKSAGSKIFVNTQSWSILGDIVTPERLPRVLKAFDELIEMEFGCPVNIPPYNHWDPRLGRISAQLPWTYENGGVYCHATAFKTAADTLVGRGDAALRCLHKIMPDAPGNPAEHSGATPYALTSSYNAHPLSWGKAGRPWLTGTQSWFMRTVVEGLLGVRRAYGGFEIAPAFPSNWQEATLNLKRRDDVYQFRIHRRRSGGSGLRVALNGKPLAGNFLPFQPPGTHEVVVEI